MIKLFFITFFIAELIIAISLILKIYNFDKCIRKLNDLILLNKNNIKSNFSDLHILMEEFAKSVIDVKTFIAEKRKEYTLNLIQTTLTYLGIFTLRGKYKKAILTYQLAKEFYEGFSEV